MKPGLATVFGEFIYSYCGTIGECIDLMSNSGTILFHILT